MVATQLRAVEASPTSACSPRWAPSRARRSSIRGQRPRLRRRRAADRVRPDDQPAVHRRPDDRAARRPARAIGCSRSGPARATRRRPRGARRAGHVDRAACRTSPRPRAGPARAARAPAAVEVRVGDGSLGAPERSAVATGSSSRRRRRRSRTRCGSSSPDGGRLVIPVGPRDRQELLVVDPARQRVGRADRRRRRFVPLVGGGRLRPEASAARYTRPAMTHVFVAPHPDDVALSCGGLIAQPPRARPERDDLTVYSGAGGRATACRAYQREALGFGSKALWPATEAFNRARHRGRLPGRRDPTRPAVGRHGRPARGDPGRRRRRRQAVLAALLVVPPGEHPQPAARRPAADRRAADPGRRRDRRAHRRRRRGRRDGDAAASRTSASRSSPRPRSSSSTCPTRSSAATRATRSCWARRATTTTAPGRAAPPRDRPARAAEGLLPARRRQPRRPPALPRRRHRAPRRGAPLGDARARTTPGS